MSAVQSNWACKLVVNVCTFLLVGALIILHSSGFGQCYNGARDAKVDIVHVEPQNEEICGVQVRKVRFLLHFRFAADETTKAWFYSTWSNKSKCQCVLAFIFNSNTVQVPVHAAERNVVHFIVTLMHKESAQFTFIFPSNWHSLFAIIKYA